MYKVWYPPYRDFKCLGTECPMNCCAYYAIRLFKKEEALFGTKPQWQNVDGKGGKMADCVEPDGDSVKCKSRATGGCIFWSDAKLCSLQMRQGAESMPVVCRTYPRIIGDYGGRLEFGLEPCCPVVAASVKDWNIGDLLVEGEPFTPAQPRFAKRDEAVRILADRSIGFRECLEKIAALYDSDVLIPEITAGGDQLEFARRETALMCWSYLVYFDGVGEVDNLVTVIVTAVSDFLDKSRGRSFASWWEMGLEFSRNLVEYYLRIGYDIDHEDRYCDVLDYEGH